MRCLFLVDPSKDGWATRDIRVRDFTQRGLGLRVDGFRLSASPLSTKERNANKKRIYDSTNHETLQQDEVHDTIYGRTIIYNTDIPTVP